MREAGNRGTQLGLDKHLSNSAYNTLLTSGNDGEGLQNKGNQVPEGASNGDVAPRQQNKEEATRFDRTISVVRPTHFKSSVWQIST